MEGLKEKSNWSKVFRSRNAAALVRRSNQTLVAYGQFILKNQLQELCVGQLDSGGFFEPHIQRLAQARQPKFLQGTLESFVHRGVSFCRGVQSLPQDVGGVVLLPAGWRFTKRIPHQIAVNVEVSDDRMFFHELQLLLLGGLAFDELATFFSRRRRSCRDFAGLVDQRQADGRPS